MLDVAKGPTQTPQEYDALHKPLREDTARLMDFYEAEVFEDRYLPAYQQAQAERDRREKQALADRERQQAESLKRVASFSEDLKK